MPDENLTIPEADHIEDYLDWSWVEEWAEQGIAEAEDLLRKHAEFDEYIQEKGDVDG